MTSLVFDEITNTHTRTHTKKTGRAFSFSHTHGTRSTALDRKRNTKKFRTKYIIAFIYIYWAFDRICICDVVFFSEIGGSYKLVSLSLDFFNYVVAQPENIAKKRWTWWIALNIFCFFLFGTFLIEILVAVFFSIILNLKYIPCFLCLNSFIVIGMLSVNPRRLRNPNNTRSIIKWKKGNQKSFF